MTDVNAVIDILNYILFGVGFIGGLLVAKAFSFWKW